MKCLYNGDCLEIMPKEIPDKSVDLILCDLPYGTTAHKWDSVLPFDKLWSEYERIIKDDGTIVLFATQPFTSLLICSNLNLYRYSFIWEKESPTGFLNSKYAPLKKTEDICVFSKSTVGSLSKHPMRFYSEVKENGKKKNNPKSKFRESAGYGTRNNKLNSDSEYESHTGCPSNILKFSHDKPSIHPTQKPVALLEYLIKLYTKEGETVLDNCMGSGSTGVACIHTGRKFIGIEKDIKYFKVAEERNVKNSLWT